MAGGCVLVGRAALGRVTPGRLAVSRLAVAPGGLVCCGAGIGVGACLGAAGLLLAGAVLLAAGGVVAGPAGDRVLVVLPGPAAGSFPAGPGAVRVQVSGMPGLPPLVRVTAPAVCSSVRASQAAVGLVPAAVAMTAVVAPGLAVS